MKAHIQEKHRNFTYSLLGIETLISSSSNTIELNCNFTYSLLGIETTKYAQQDFKYEDIAISLTPY